MSTLSTTTDTTSELSSSSAPVSIIDWPAIMFDLLLGDILTLSPSLPYSALLLNHCFDSPTLHYSPADSHIANPKLQRFAKLWNAAKVRHSVDGGSNYLHALQQIDDTVQNPEIISGDFDSIEPEVLKHYRQASGPNNDRISIVETPDQDDTDFTKAIRVLAGSELFADSKSEAILVFYTSSGRLDHVLSIYNTLYRFSPEVNSGRLPPIIAIDLGASVSVLLTEGYHRLPVVKSASWCSLVPLNGPSKVSTTNFRWNLSEQTLEFGKFISTSQEFQKDCDYVTVQIFDRPLLFSFEF